jgi:hypothetical protein
MKKLLIIILIWTVAGLAVETISNVYQADLDYVKSQDYLTDGNIVMTAKMIDKAISLNQFEPNYLRGRAKVETVGLVYSRVTDTSEIKKAVLKNLQSAYKLNPENLVTLRNSLPLYYFLAVKNINAPAGSENIDLNFISNTKNFYAMCKTKYGKDVGVLVSLAKYEKKLGLMTEYAESAEMVRSLRPDLLEWHEVFR